jgi:hypothetical protein
MPFKMTPDPGGAKLRIGERRVNEGLFKIGAAWQKPVFSNSPNQPDAPRHWPARSFERAYA